MRPFDPRLLRHARATISYLAVLVAVGVAAAGLVLVQADLLATGIAAVDTGVLVPLAAVVAGRALLAWGTEVAAFRASAAVKSSLRRAVLGHALRLGPRWLAGQRTGELSTLITRGVDALDGYFAKYLPQLALAVIVPVAVLARVAGADLIAAATIAVTLPLIPVFMILVGLATVARTRRRWRAMGRLAHHFTDVVAGLATLKAFGRANAQAAHIRRLTGEYRRATLGTLRLAFLSSLVLELIATLSVALVAVGIGLRLVGGTLDLRTALLVLVLAPEAYLPLRAVGTHFHASADGLAAAGEVFAVLETPVPGGGHGPVPLLDTAVITAESISVTHPDRSAAAPGDLSFTLGPGEIVALAGPSGTGKSTLLAVLLGFLPPTSGRILIGAPAASSAAATSGAPASPGPASSGAPASAGGRGTDAPAGGSVSAGGNGDGGPGAADLATVDIEQWRSRLAWVPQDPYLFTGTVADNIRLGDPSAPPGAVVRAAADAGLADLDLATRVGERGVGLSAGQRRRVALARALLRCAGLPAPVLLLDEPTAGVDPATETLILTAVRRITTAGGRALVVAHRPAVLAAADRVVPVTTGPDIPPPGPASAPAPDEAVPGPAVAPPDSGEPVPGPHEPPPGLTGQRAPASPAPVSTSPESPPPVSTSSAPPTPTSPGSPAPGSSVSPTPSSSDSAASTSSAAGGPR